MTTILAPARLCIFDVICPLLIELQQWTGNIILVKVKSHTGCLMNERSDALPSWLSWAGLKRNPYTVLDRKSMGPFG